MFTKKTVFKTLLFNLWLIYYLRIKIHIMHILISDNSVIPVIKYGGTQRVFWDLGKELVKLGHKVTFLVKEGSTCDFADILTLDPTQPISNQIPESIDILHLNQGLTLAEIDNIKKPYIFTMHGNASPNKTLPINTVFVSKNHAERHGSNCFVYNGLDWDNYSKIKFSNEKKYCHFLGRANWKVKNMQGACKIADISNEKLVIMGGDRWNYTNLKRSFKYMISPKIEFKGMVDNATKMQVMYNSKGLIFPVKWHEPFGLAVIESLYTGCPVFATPYGSLKELVPPEVGVLSNSSLELAEAIKTVSFSPKICHEYAVDKFNSRVMAESYLQYYNLILQGETLHTEHPQLKDTTAKSLLNFE